MRNLLLELAAVVVFTLPFWVAYVAMAWDAGIDVANRAVLYTAALCGFVALCIGTAGWIINHCDDSKE